MHVYGSILSPFVCRVAIALRHKNIKHEIIMPEGGIKSPEFLKMNPFGKMPTIKDGKIILPESSVILEYIEAKYPKKKIIPNSIKGSSSARLTATICDLYVQSPVLALFTQRDPKTQDKLLIKQKLSDLEKGLNALNQYLQSGKPWANGKSLTIADCYACPSLFFVNLLVPGFGNKDPLQKHKNVKRYWNQIKRNTPTKEILKEMNAAAKAMFAK